MWERGRKDTTGRGVTGVLPEGGRCCCVAEGSAGVASAGARPTFCSSSCGARIARASPRLAPITYVTYQQKCQTARQKRMRWERRQAEAAHLEILILTEELTLCVMQNEQCNAKRANWFADTQSKRLCQLPAAHKCVPFYAVAQAPTKWMNGTAWRGHNQFYQQQTSGHTEDVHHQSCINNKHCTSISLDNDTCCLCQFREDRPPPPPPNTPAGSPQGRGGVGVVYLQTKFNQMQRYMCGP